MNNNLIRTDNKRLLLVFDILFTLLVISSLIINILNFKKVSYLIIVSSIILASIAIYFLIYSVIVKRSKKPLQLEDNNLAFYVSANTNNKLYKKLISMFDALSAILIVLSLTFYFYKMDMNINRSKKNRAM